MSKHQAILDYLEKLPIGKRVSVRSISNYLQVSDGTAYRAIKEAENRGIVETRPRSGTVRVKSKKGSPRTSDFPRDCRDYRFGSLGRKRRAGTRVQQVLYRGHDRRAYFRLCLLKVDSLIVGDRTNIQRLALQHDNAVLVTGGFDVDPSILELGRSGQTLSYVPSMIPIPWRP